MRVGNKKQEIADNEIDMYGKKLYTRTFSETPTKIKLYEYEIPFPDEEEDKYCINYGLPIDQQKFRYTFKPNDLANWEVNKKEKFIDDEYYRRQNGIWIFIKGIKIYLTGLHYGYLNYWTSKKFGRLRFIYTDAEFFWMWMHCVLDPFCYGLIDFKCRQIGDTEKVLWIMWEYASRVRNQICAMQSINEEHIIKGYQRLLHAHNKMSWYFKPENKGTEAPVDGLVFNYQPKFKSVNRAKEQYETYGTTTQSDMDYEFPSLGSEIQFGPSKEGHFDGSTLGRYYLDEFGKMDAMNPVDTWGVIKPAIFNEIVGRMVGKALFTSTVEEVKSGKSLEWAQTLWKQSDPSNKTDNGETQSGLYRIFRNSLDRGNVDDFGFVNKEEAEQKIINNSKAYIAANDIKGLIKYKRKNPLTIEDVFTSANNESTFDIEKLTQRRHRVMHEISPKKAVRGNFEWLDGKRDTTVIWIPNSNGLWLVSGHPKDFGAKENAKSEYSKRPRPKNPHKFCCGIDPYDYETTLDTNPSLAGLVIKVKLDPLIDGDKFDEEGKPLFGGEYFITNRVICTYLHRHASPSQFYEDVIKTIVYYGTEFLPEKNKFGGLSFALKERGYDNYVMDMANGSLKNFRGQSETNGLTASNKTIETYFSMLSNVTTDWWNTLDHLDLIDQLLSMNYANRGKRDLGVAFGFCEIASQNFTYKPKEPSKEEIPYFEDYIV